MQHNPQKQLVQRCWIFTELRVHQLDWSSLSFRIVRLLFPTSTITWTKIVTTPFSSWQSLLVCTKFLAQCLRPKCLCKTFFRQQLCITITYIYRGLCKLGWLSFPLYSIIIISILESSHNRDRLDHLVLGTSSMSSILEKSLWIHFGVIIGKHLHLLHPNFPKS